MNVWVGKSVSEVLVIVLSHLRRASGGINAKTNPYFLSALHFQL